MELARILARHPDFVARAAPPRTSGRASKLGAKLALPAGRRRADLPLAGGGAEGLRRAPAVVFLCTPPEVSIELAPRRWRRVRGWSTCPVASGWPPTSTRAGTASPTPTPSCWPRRCIRCPRPPATWTGCATARLVSNPGCYPTVSALAVLPLLRAGLIDPATLIIDAKSGTTGAGRKATEEMSFSEVDGDLRAYQVLAPPAHAGDRAGPGAGRGGRGQGGVHSAPAARTPGDPGHRLRAADRRGPGQRRPDGGGGPGAGALRRGAPVHPRGRRPRR